MNDITKELFKNVYTKSDFYRQSAILVEFLEFSYFSKPIKEPTKKNLKIFLKNKELNEFKSNSFAVLKLGDDFFKKFNKDNFYNLLKESEKEMEKFPTLVLYVPVSFPQEEIVKLGFWFRKNIDKDIFLDLKIDSSVLAGCMFVFRDKFYDLSFKKLLKEKREEFLKMINEKLKAKNV